MSEAAGTHCESARLALVAVGQPAPSAVFDRHAQSCPGCRHQAEAMTEVVTVARASLAERAYLQPPASVWRGIAAAAEEPTELVGIVVELPEQPPAPAPMVSPVEVSRPPIALWVVVVLVMLAILGFLVF